MNYASKQGLQRALLKHPSSQTVIRQLTTCQALILGCHHTWLSQPGEGARARFVFILHPLRMKAFSFLFLLVYSYNCSYDLDLESFRTQTL